ncbi:amidase [Acetobacter nitrogenifigens]|uniref:amidase n=1 Tax=Acetobacter nitrogenifigens TaxID=285268 RepID=UPI000A059FA0|nr:amidase [Acetobacter nitrogenifigens]
MSSGVDIRLAGAWGRRQPWKVRPSGCFTRTVHVACVFVLASCAAPAPRSVLDAQAPGGDCALPFTVAASLHALETGTATAASLAACARTRVAMNDDPLRRDRYGLHAVLALDPTAQEQAAASDRRRRDGRLKGTLDGVPVLLKDNIETTGTLPTTAGSLALAANVSRWDSTVAAKLRAAGAVLLGKTNLSEWANFRSGDSISGWSGVGGLTRNAFDRNRSACGSSSGSAVAVAEGIVPAAIGTETDGSVTCPAALNGLVGLKPTLGLVSRRGVVPLAPSQDTPGPIAHTVADAALLLDAIAGSDPADSATHDAESRRGRYGDAVNAAADRRMLQGVRLGVLRFAVGSDPRVAALFEQALERLRAAGAVLVDIKAVDLTGLRKEESVVLHSEFHAAIDTYLAHAPASVSSRSLADLIRFNVAHAGEEMPYFGQDSFEKSLTANEDDAYRVSLLDARRLAGAEGIDAMLSVAHVEALLAPTTRVAWPIDLEEADPPGDGTGSATHLAAVSGYPHLTVPMGLAPQPGTAKGLPVGLSLVGAAWSDARLLALGAAYEQIRGAFPVAPETREVR